RKAGRKALEARALRAAAQHDELEAAAEAGRGLHGAVESLREANVAGVGPDEAVGGQVELATIRLPSRGLKEELAGPVRNEGDLPGPVDPRGDRVAKRRRYGGDRLCARIQPALKPLGQPDEPRIRQLSQS